MKFKIFIVFLITTIFVSLFSWKPLDNKETAFSTNFVAVTKEAKPVQKLTKKASSKENKKTKNKKAVEKKNPVIYQYNITEEDIEFLTKCVVIEAGYTDPVSQRLMLDCILNRIDSEYFPNTLYGVLEQAHQFDVVRNGSTAYANPTEEDYEVVRSECRKGAKRHNNEVQFYRTEHYHDFGTPLFSYGGHYFSKL